MIQVENYIGGKFVTLSDDFDDISPLDFSIIAKAVSYTHLTLPTKA